MRRGKGGGPPPGAKTDTAAELHTFRVVRRKALQEAVHEIGAANKELEELDSWVDNCMSDAGLVSAARAREEANANMLASMAISGMKDKRGGAGKKWRPHFLKRSLSKQSSFSASRHALESRFVTFNNNLIAPTNNNNPNPSIPPTRIDIPTILAPATTSAATTTATTTTGISRQILLAASELSDADGSLASPVANSVFQQRQIHQQQQQQQQTFNPLAHLLPIESVKSGVSSSLRTSSPEELLSLPPISPPKTSMQKFRHRLRQRATRWKKLAAEDLIDILNSFQDMMQSEDGLTEDEFVELFSEILTVPKAALRRTFRFMDANENLKLSSDEFLTHILMDSMNTASSASQETVRMLAVKRASEQLAIVRTLKVIPFLPAYVACTSTGNLLSVDVNSMVVQRNLEIPEREEPFEPPLGAPPEPSYSPPSPDFAFSRSQERFFVSMSDHSVRICNTTTWKYITTTRCCLSPIRSLAVVPRASMESDLLYIGDYRGGVSFCSTKNPVISARRFLHAGSVNGFLIPQQSPIAATYGADGKLTMFDLETLQVSSVRREHEKGIFAASQSRDWGMTLTMDDSGKMFIWDQRQFRSVGSMIRKTSIAPVGAALEVDQYTAFSAYTDKNVHLWDIREWKTVQIVQDQTRHQPDCLSAFIYDPPRSQLVTAGNRVCNLPVVSQAQYVFLQYMADAGGSATEQRNRVKSEMIPAHQKLLDEDTVQRLQKKVIDPKSLEPPAGIMAMAYSQLFHRLVTVDAICNVAVWNPLTGRRLFHFVARDENDKMANIVTACLDRLERRLVTAYRNGCVKMWNYNSGEELATFPTLGFEPHRVEWLRESRKWHDIAVFGAAPFVLFYADTFGREEHHEPKKAPRRYESNKNATIMAIAVHTRFCFIGDLSGHVMCWDTDFIISTWHTRMTRGTTPHSMCEQPVQQLFFVADSAMLCVCFAGGDIEYLKRTTGLPLAYREAVFPREAMICPNLSQNLLMVADDTDGRLSLYSTDAINQISFDVPVLIQRWMGHRSTVKSIVWCEQMQSFASGGSDGQVCIWGSDGSFFAKLDQPVAWPVCEAREAKIAAVAAAENASRSRESSPTKELTPPANATIIDPIAIMATSLRLRRKQVNTEFEREMKIRKERERLEQLSGVRVINFENHVELSAAMDAQRMRFNIEFQAPSMEHAAILQRVHQELLALLTVSTTHPSNPEQEGGGGKSESFAEEKD